MKILDSKKIADTTRDEILADVNKLAKRLSLHIIRVGDNDSCSRYVSVKQRLGKMLGIDVVAHVFSAVGDEELIKLIGQLNQSDQCDGIIVQLPLPKENNQEKILRAICPAKDVDGLTMADQQLWNEEFLPPVVRGVAKTMEFYKLSLRKKTVLLIGKGFSAGLPLMRWLSGKPCTLIVCDKNEAHLARFFPMSDFIVSVVGKHNLIDPRKLARKSYFFDVGTCVVDDKICGDLNCRYLSKADFKGYTPTPGGIGRLTAIFLMKNLVDLYKRRLSLNQK